MTGGAQGIGRATAELFASLGCSAAICDVDEEALDEVTSNTGLSIMGVPADIAVEEDVTKCVDGVIKAYGRIDYLVNNAGIGVGKSIEDLSMDEWDRVLAVNLRGPFMMAKYCSPHMKTAGGGAIVNISSTRALMSEADTFPYSASKGGLVALTHSLAVSLGPYGVRANCICPGWIETGEWQKAAAKRTPVHSESDKAQHPAMRVGTPLDIAQACAYLCSSAAGFITGANLIIDGGMTVKMIYAE